MLPLTIYIDLKYEAFDAEEYLFMIYNQQMLRNLQSKVKDREQNIFSGRAALWIRGKRGVSILNFQTT